MTLSPNNWAMMLLPAKELSMARKRNSDEVRLKLLCKTKQ
jgi:hypothetical protein